MANTRQKNVEWNVGGDGGQPTWEMATVAVLMDIRDELQRLNHHLLGPEESGAVTTQEDPHGPL